MLDKIKKAAQQAKDAVATATVLVGDLNGDGKVDQEDARVAADWAKRTASSIGDEAAKLGKETLRSPLVKDVAAGAAVGAAIAIPIPVVGPAAGAVVGAGIGVYTNLTRKGGTSPAPADSRAIQKDIHADLLKLDDLRQKSIITEEEFESQKTKLLKGE
jgi:hypothetical protein